MGSNRKTITFSEVDELNNSTSTYIYSKPAPKSGSKDSPGRVDIAVSKV